MSTPLVCQFVKRAICLVMACASVGVFAKTSFTNPVQASMSPDPCVASSAAVAPAAPAAPKARTIKRTSRPRTDVGQASAPAKPRVARPRPRPAPAVAMVPALLPGCGAASPLDNALGQLVPAAPVLGRSEVPVAALPILAKAPAMPTLEVPTRPSGSTPQDAFVPPLPSPQSPFDDTDTLNPFPGHFTETELTPSAEVPEPATFALVLAGVLATCLTRRPRRTRRS